MILLAVLFHDLRGKGSLLVTDHAPPPFHRYCQWPRGSHADDMMWTPTPLIFQTPAQPRSLNNLETTNKWRNGWIMHPFIYLSPPALPVHLMWTPNSDHIQLYPTGKSCSKPLGPMWNLPPGSHLQLELDLLRMLCASDRPSLTKRSPATAGQGAQLDEMGNISFPYPVKLTHAKPPLKNAWIKLGHFFRTHDPGPSHANLGHQHHNIIKPLNLATISGTPSCIPSPQIRSKMRSIHGSTVS